MRHRLERLRAVLPTHHLDALLVTDAANRRYLSGFTGSSGSLLITADRAVLLSDFRYQSQAAREAPEWEFTLLPSAAGFAAQLPNVLRELGGRRLGFEAAHATVAQFSAWQRAMRDAGARVEWLATEGIVEQLRTSKDAAEITTLRRAIAITDEAFAAVRSLLRPEMRERDAAWELEKAMRERGADGLAFDIIVAAGDNGSRPHARAGDDQLGVGRPIVMDFGAKLQGYHADMTRTVILGAADEQFWNVYNVVLDAQKRAAAELRAGMRGQHADAVARDRLAAAGFGAAFGHSLGHGVGLAIHEGPRLAQTSADVLEAGAVFSVEPGVYLPGWGGVRIEDLVLLTDSGAEALTQSSKDSVISV